MNTIASHGQLEFLVDAKGIYGLKWPNRPWQSALQPACQYVLRPDKISEDQNYGTSRALHTLPRNSRIFRHCSEYRMARDLCNLMVAHAGLRIDGYLKEDSRSHYWGLVRGAQRSANWHIGRVIEEAADRNALKLARRFPFSVRWPIYCAASQEPRLAQLAETFPVLAVRLASGMPNELYRATVDMIVEGRRLRDIAAFCNLPIQMRHVAPGAAVDALRLAPLFADRPDLLQHMPPTTAAARRWLHALLIADDIGGPFVEWTARNAARMGGHMIEVQSLASDLRDFVLASYRSEALTLPDHVRAAFPMLSPNKLQHCKCVIRRFDPAQSLQTVMALSQEWHEAVATAQFDGEECEFPAPWCPAATVAGFEIVPITNSADLYREGAAMHHCASTYSGAVMSGRAFIYSIQKDGKRVATAELMRDGDRVRLGQVRGPCNAHADKAVTAALRAWLRKHPAKLPEPPKPETCRDFHHDFDADIPF